MTEITSRRNQTVLDTAALRDKKSRDMQGLFFTEGMKILNEALSVGRMPVRVFVTNTFLNSHPQVAKLETDVIKVTDEVYDKITDENAPEGILAVFEKKELTPCKDSCVLILEGIQDPGNMGTLMRCAVAFGVSQVLTVACADIYSPKTVRSTMGAVFKMPCRNFADIDSAVEYARKITDNVIATALHSDSISIADTDTSRSAIMIGSEGKGLSPRAIELCDKKVTIPIENIESLNASVAGAICMYDSMMKRKKL